MRWWREARFGMFILGLRHHGLPGRRAARVGSRHEQAGVLYLHVFDWPSRVS